MASKAVILPDSPNPKDGTAHLRPILDFLFSKGNAPADGVDEYMDEQVILTYLLKKKVDWEELQQNFEFPDTIKLYPDEGVLVDKRNALQIVGGAED